MPSKYDTYWQNHLDAILALFDQARTAGTSSPLALTDLETMGTRVSWYGKLEIVGGKHVYGNAAHVQSLGEVLTASLPDWAREPAWTVTIGRDSTLTIQQLDPRRTNWFEDAYRTAKQKETFDRAGQVLGPLRQDPQILSTGRTESGVPVYAIFATRKDGWLAPRRSRLETTAAEKGQVIISITGEEAGVFSLWIIPAVELLAAIQNSGLSASLDSGDAFSFNLQTDPTADLVRQLKWDIRPYRKESGDTELTRSKFWPDGGPPRPPMPPQRILAKPFSDMFASWEEAEWAFDLLGKAAQRLGLSGPDDPMGAWTLRRRAGQYHLHFSYGQWLVLGFAGADGNLSLRLALFRNRLDLPATRIESFTQREGETPVSLYYLEASAWRALEDTEQEVYGETLDYIRQLFAGWSASPYHKHTNAPLAVAVFDAGARRRLLGGGIKAPAQRFWKIAPGDDAWQWSECRDDGFIAIGWEELGDLSNLDRAGFEARRAEIQQVNPDWTNDALEQVWKFTLIQEGDRIVANRGTAEVLGIGTVTGPYYFVPGVRHGHRLPVQWDDTTARKVNEGGWRRTLVELTEAKFSALAAATPSASVDNELVAHAESAFSQRAFQLLQGIHEQPTKAYYQTHKDEFKTEVTEPFQRIFREVAGRLSALVRASMETEADLFSIFPKNDYGRGGAWDFYWGAFYPKGGRRTQDAQLHASIRHDLLKFGFSLGAYGSAQRQRFQRNCQTHHAALANLPPDVFADSRLVFGRTENISVTPAGQIVSSEACTWQEFLADPTRASNTAAVVLPRATILRTSAEALIADMVQTFERLFPLILLAVEDDPLPAIDRYLNPDPSGTLVGPEAPEPYDADHFLSTTSLSVDDMTELREMLEERRQIILYGPPGTGKTFVARELGKLLTGLAKPPPERMEIVQFHPAYSYEDFIEGIRPESKAGADGRYMIDYPARPGVFQRFCQQAQSISGPCVFIIDEINRGNIPRIFGELMLLLEYRGLDVTLAYSGRRFRIPENIYLIGTMNTADRSIALVDFALRRRFHFFHFSADPDLLKRWLEHNPVNVPYLLELYRRLSTEAIDDPDFAIGPSHFMRRDLTEVQLQRIWRRNIEPYLKEYYVDRRERSKAERWAWDGALVKAIRQGQGND